ncbi:hypothetical protein BKA70DRAFT_1491713 [Coprinopsis sp. MPI-PUGE-AT-0042]|nr:hypothetical protein BKA70DRAFT_1491713 [Coprinopsis sp. MPI-PUGE-AT-0042]
MPVPFAGGRPLPLEILENIAFEIVAASPLGNPKQLLPLLVTNKAVHNALAMGSGTALYSRICGLKFDIGAVTRRAFTPLTRDLDGHLVQMCSMLKFFASGDIFHEDAPDQLLIAYVALLENDGKNRAQLEHVGIVDFVDRFVRQRLHEGKEDNNGWPREDEGRVYALWLMWFLSTREHLLAETEEKRAQILHLVFPFLACPNRYTSTIVPPNHFSLPLGPNSPMQNHIFIVNTVHGSHPVYHTAKKSASRLYHFSAQPVFMEPLIAPVASLLFWSRRELNGVFRIPAHLPQDRAARQGQPGLTQVDIHEFNATQVAKLPECVVWDWDLGTAVNHGDCKTTSPMDKPSSTRFDVDWWRARLCTDILTKQPKFRLGSVYLRGMMTGLWQGIMFGQSQSSFLEILNQRKCSPSLSEHSTCFTSKPLWLRFTEHGFVRTPTAVETTPVPQAFPEEIPITITTVNGTVPTSIPVDEGQPLDDGALQDKFLDVIQPNNKMHTTEFIVTQRSPFDRPGSGGDLQAAAELGGPIDRAGATTLEGDRYVYENFEAGRESVHQQMTKAKERSACMASARGENSLQPHCGCLKCLEIERFLERRKERDCQRTAYETKSSEEIESIFRSVGMEEVAGYTQPGYPGDSYIGDGDSTSRQTFDLGLHFESHPGSEEDGQSVTSNFSTKLAAGRDEDALGIRESHDRYRVEKCDDGVVDVVLTGEVDDNHRLCCGSDL